MLLILELIEMVKRSEIKVCGTARSEIRDRIIRRGEE
jgi:hypothetical protein